MTTPDKHALLYALAALACLATWEAQAARQEGSQLSMRLPVKSQEVLNFLHHSNEKEIALGKLALQTSQSPAIREFGTRLINDHAGADEKVRKVAAQEQMAVASQPPTSDETNVMIFLKGLSGQKFDQAFADQMDADHKTAIETLKGDLSSLPASSRTRELVENLLPKLSQQRANALTISAQLSVSSQRPALQ